MAINSSNVIGDKTPTRSMCSSNASNLSSCRLIKINYSGKESCSSRKLNKVNNFNDVKSPYLTNDKVHLNRVTEKKLIQKKPTDIISSYPLAVSVYKANSDEFKLTKAEGKKIKKSVLTLPNEPVRMPTTYTVSDLNDSEYFNDAKDNHNIRKTKKRRSVKRNKKSRGKDPEIEYLDRDARYCSQLNIDLDCSSSEVINLNGNGEGICNSLYKHNNSTSIKNDPNDVWAVLRNINKFQFRPPPVSQESVAPFRKRRPFNNKGSNRNDTRIIETCHTEEFSYISSYEFDNKSQNSCSLSSSFDRITVIDKQSEQDIIKQFSEQIFKSNLNIRGLRNDNISKRNQNKIEPKLTNSNKNVLWHKKKEHNKQILPNTPQKTISKRNVSVDNKTSFPNDTFITKLKATGGKPSVTSVASNCGSPNKDYPTGNGTLVTNEINKLAMDFCNLKDITKNPSTKLSNTIDDSGKQLNGITKVVLSKGQDIVSAKLSEAPGKPRPNLMLPNNKMPKITLTEIKRRIANLKFPIVILGKDQLTNRGIHVANCDPLHFNGLDEKIWPYMLEWSKNKRILNIQDSKNNEVLVKSKNLKVKPKISQGMESSIRCLQKDKNDKRNVGFNNKNTHLYVPESCSSKIKPTPISILKSKMFHFLHKHPSPVKGTENNWNKNELLERKTDKITSTCETTNEIEFGHSNPIYLSSQHILPHTKKVGETKLFKKSNYSLKHPWAKAKWTSDIIEIIINKVRNGVYYGIDKREVKYKIDTTEVSTQTELNVIKNASCQNIISTNIPPELSKNDYPLKSIPGFDEALSTLEIETFTKSKIAIKHCVTNIIVQFDVQVIAEKNNIEHIKNSLSCIPIHQKHKHEKIFKCSTIVHNETLPAELCTIIPRMMRTILDANKNLCPHPVTVGRMESHLTAISEFQGPELKSYLTDIFSISDQLRPMLTGHYTSEASNNTKTRNKDLRLPADRINSINKILSRVDTSILCHLKPSFTVQNTRILMIREKISKLPSLVKNRISNCMALQSYKPSKLALIPYIGPFNINEFINIIINKYDFNSNIKDIRTYGEIYNRTVKSSIIIPTTVNKAIVPFNPVNDIVVVSLFKAFIKINHDDNTVFVPNSNTTRSISTGNKQNTHVVIDKNKIEPKTKEGNMKRKQIKVMSNKRSYVKFYRKCNSMSSISAFKSTPLSKITNVDEFCQALGSNSLTSVLTGGLEKKILKAIDEMKNWIMEISPKQALLVLLLTNKKDTPNINRLRPILLQGIAVNRITKADELDTEIEVIERENFNRLSQYEGITYLPASAQNQDNLLEELYWIAKTTASDYKKTFDESSEKLLKSLLEKRKKLNPSYLRVMARYVGLGLLTPAK